MSFRTIKAFPFCVMEDDPERVNELHASMSTGSDYAGAYAGTAFPFRMSLSQAVRLFWRTRQLNFNASLDSGVGEGVGMDKYWTTSNAIDITTNFLSSRDDVFRVRLCEGYRTLYFDYSTQSELSSGGGVAGLTWFGGGEYLPRCLRVYRSGPEDDDNSYDYYPNVSAAFSRYGETWATFWPHISSTTINTSTGVSRTLTMSVGEAVFSFNMYHIENEGAPAVGTAEFSDWEVTLW